MSTYRPRRGSVPYHVCKLLQQQPDRVVLLTEIAQMSGYASPTRTLIDAVKAGLLEHTPARRGVWPASYSAGPRLASYDLDAKAPPRVWSPELDERLRRSYPNHTSVARLAGDLGVTVHAMRTRAALLGVKKTSAAKSRIASNRYSESGGRPYVSISRRTERILDLMRDGAADGATARQIAELAGLESTILVASALRAVIKRGIVLQRFVSQRRCTYHLNRGQDWTETSSDGMPVQIVVPASAVARQLTPTNVPTSVFDLGRLAA